MALKPTIYKFNIALSDLDRQVYDSLALTVARHPSETAERMLARVLAYCFNAQQGLEFCKGLSEQNEPDLWLHGLDGSLLLWIEVGEPAADRIRKASRQAAAVKVYCFNSKADTWWELNRQEVAPLKAAIFQLPWPPITAIAAQLERTTDWSVTISDGSAYLATGQGEYEVPLQQRQ
jgi:uncharacterized protein YaeQ